MGISISSFDRVIEFLKPVSTKGRSGQVKETFVQDGKAFAKVQVKSSDEKEVGDRIEFVVILSVETYNIATVNNRYRFTYDGETYEVVSLDRVERNRFMKIEATKVFD